MSSATNRFIDKRYLSELHREYLNDENIKALNEQKLKVIQKSSIKMDNRGNIVADEASENLLFHLDQLIDQHTKTYYLELFK